jgi:hypothetical protein
VQGTFTFFNAVKATLALAGIAVSAFLGGTLPVVVTTSALIMVFSVLSLLLQCSKTHSTTGAARAYQRALLHHSVVTQKTGPGGAVSVTHNQYNRHPDRQHDHQPHQQPHDAAANQQQQQQQQQRVSSASPSQNAQQNAAVTSLQQCPGDQHHPQQPTTTSTAETTPPIVGIVDSNDKGSWNHTQTKLFYVTLTQLGCTIATSAVSFALALTKVINHEVCGQVPVGDSAASSMQFCTAIASLNVITIAAAFFGHLAAIADAQIISLKVV